MPENAFVGRTTEPTPEQLATALGAGAHTLWSELLSTLSEECPIQEWHSYSPKHGWALRMKRGKRNILYVVPRHGSFEVAFILGGKAIAAAADAKLPARIMKVIDGGKQWPEGREVRLQIKEPRQIGAVATLAHIKIKN